MPRAGQPNGGSDETPPLRPLVRSVDQPVQVSFVWQSSTVCVCSRKVHFGSVSQVLAIGILERVPLRSSWTLGVRPTSAVEPPVKFKFRGRMYGVSIRLPGGNWYGRLTGHPGQRVGPWISVKRIGCFAFWREVR